jgi:hypothetical protein
MRKPVNGQFKVNLDIGQVYVVGSKVTESPQLEKQGNLLAWAEDRVKLERWVKDGQS